VKRSTAETADMRMVAIIEVPESATMRISARHSLRSGS
jgi:hypothetical protein